MTTAGGCEDVAHETAGWFTGGVLLGWMNRRGLHSASPGSQVLQVGSGDVDDGPQRFAGVHLADRLVDPGEWDMVRDHRLEVDAPRAPQVDDLGVGAADVVATVEGGQLSRRACRRKS